MDFVITMCCNLCCKNCSSLMPYYKNPSHLDLNTIKTNLEKLSRSEKIKNIQIIGGETFLHPDITEILLYVSTLNFEIISVYTNGTIVPNGLEDILDKLDDRFTFYITEYERSTKVKELCEMFDKYKTQHEINEFGNIYGSKKGSEWIKSGNPIFKPIPKTNEDTCDQIMSCLGNKVYKCQRFAHLDQIGATKLADNEWCYINDLNERYEQLKQRGFTKSCYYCLRGTNQAVNIPKGS